MHFICVYYSFSKASGAYVGVCPYITTGFTDFCKPVNIELRKVFKIGLRYVVQSDMPPGTDCPYPIRILAFFEMIRPYHVVIRI